MNSIKLFATQPFITALRALFAELQIPVNYIDELPATPDSILGEMFKPENEAHRLISDVYLFGMVNDEIFQGNSTFSSVDEVKKLDKDYDGLLIFGVTLQPSNHNQLPTRSQLAGITRAFNRAFPYTPVTIIFRYSNHISLANTERTRYKQQWREGEKIGKVSLLKDVDCVNTHAGHKRIISSLAAEAIRNADRMNRLESFADLYKGWQKVFSTDVLNEQFYKDYQQISVKIIRAVFPNQISNKLKAHQGALNLLNRMMFLYFIQKKGWLNDDPDFMLHFWQDYLQTGKSANDFHDNWLNKVFFKALNGKAYKEPMLFKIFPEKYHSTILNFPFLNGGLFTENEEDTFLLDDELFVELYEFFQGYVFTISENTPDEVNLEINPELLGKMYEGMINATDLDDVDAEHGIVYTEPPEINFMTRRSFVEILANKLPAGYSREFLYHFIFDNPEAKRELIGRYKPNTSELLNAILSITAIDPSCGSGSMLIGVIHLQVELIKCLREYIKQPMTAREEFYLKKQIISESIYGVDVKEWAVRIAELRFWLYMISEAEFTTEELTKEPLLPNLDFKLRQGNSLLQEIGNLDFSLKGLFKGRKKNVGTTRKLNEFIKKKKDFITNQSESGTSFKKLKEEELFVFKSFIKELVEENRKDIFRLSKGDGQISFFGDEKKGHLFEEQISDLEKENEQLYRILDSIKSTGRLPFSYDIDFMEIFLTKEDPGFDLVIGNPPYVRQEDILPADDALELERLLKAENKTEKASTNKAYKEKLSAKVFETWPFLNTKAKTQIEGKTKTIDIYGKKVPGRSDLYVYFQLLCPALLNSRGTFCFIISNSWLDVEFGGFVQHFLLKHTRLHAIYDCSVRSFSASVNTIIYLHSAVINQNLSESRLRTLKPDGPPVRFVMNKADYSLTAYAPLLIEQEHLNENTFRSHYRVILKKPNELWEEAWDTENHQYQSNKWGGKYLRAPEIYFTILEKGKNKLVPLKQIADVRFGIKTGANEFFILSREKADEWGIEDEFLVPFLTSPKDLESIKVSDNDLKYYLFLCNQTKDQLDNKRALKYIQWGEQSEILNGQEKRAFHIRKSINGRKNWYSIGARKKPDFNCNYMVDSIMRFYHGKVFAVNNFHEIHLKKSTYTQLSIILNSTLTQFFTNIMGRSNLGDGLMKIEGFEVAEVPILEQITLSNNNLVNEFESRNCYDLFTELGFDRKLPIREQEPTPLPDRKELDDIIFDELCLTPEERKEVYWATAELVKQRLDKAGSR